MKECASPFFAIKPNCCMGRSKRLSKNSPAGQGHEQNHKQGLDRVPVGRSISIASGNSNDAIQIYHNHHDDGKDTSEYILTALLTRYGLTICKDSIRTNDDLQEYQ